MNKRNVLVTGGAGFIGSHIVDALMNDDRIHLVRVFDNLSHGDKNNIRHHFSNPRFEFQYGDIRNISDVIEACRGIHLISHQAAIGSVPRSINEPILYQDVNIKGTMNVFDAAEFCNSFERIVFASSSSVYGDLGEGETTPRIESRIGQANSPYSWTKQVNESTARLYKKIYGINSIGLRYFNVFGARQNPNGAYAAVIPKFINNIKIGEKCSIYGNGEQVRDFTHISNVVLANILALFVEDEMALNKIYNIGTSYGITIERLYHMIADTLDQTPNYIHESPRKNDVQFSMANIDLAGRLLNYRVLTTIKKGLKYTIENEEITF